MAAVVTRQLGSCSVESLALRPPAAHDVVVRIEASGICHSDISVMTGDLPGRLPVVLGHEGAGVVMEIGTEVTTVRVGDRVVLSAIPTCGICYFCARGEPNLCSNSATLRGLGFLDGSAPLGGAAGLGTFSDGVVVNERAAVAVRTDLPFEQLATLGCAVLTGAGSAMNLATIGPGDSVLVIGAGGIGLSGIQGARLQGALPIVALDPSPASRDLAGTCGATHVFDPTDAGVDEALMELTSGIGFDTALDCVGSSATLERAWALTRRGGTVVEIGVPASDVAVTVPLAQIPLTGKRLIGCVYGGSSVFHDIPRYVALAESGAMDLAALLGQRVRLVDVPRILAGPLGAGRTVIIP